MEGHLGLQLLLQLGLILINAFFAMSEIAVISLNEGKLRRQAEEGDKTSGRLLKMVNEPSGFLSTIQVAITLSGFLGSAFAARNLSTRLTEWLINDCGWVIKYSTLDAISVIVITLILSYFTLILGELVPKRIAMHNPEKVAKAVSGVVNAIAFILKPVVWFLAKSTNAVLRLIGINPKESAEKVSEDDIRLMVDIGEEKGTIESTEKELIENIFEFNNTTAEDIMVHRTDMVVIWLDDPIEKIIETIQDSGLSRFPVCREDVDDVVGIIRSREFFLNLHSKAPKEIKDLVTPAYFVPESVRTDVLFRDMQEKKTHMSIVIDEYGGISGLVTMEDLLEEIVGNIFDESDKAEPQEITQVGDNVWRISGGANIEDINETLGVDIEESDEYETLGGLIYNNLSSIPADGSKPEIVIGNLDIKVQLIEDRRVEWAIVKILPNPEAESEEADTNSRKSRKE